MFGAVYLLVAELHSVRVVRLHHEMPFAHGAFEALSVEDDFVHGDLLHQVNPFVATLTLVAGAGGRTEQVRQALRRPHRRGGHLVVAASDGVRYTQLNKSITLPCAVCVAAGCGRPLQCSTGVSFDFMYYSIRINNGTAIHELNGGGGFAWSEAVTESLLSRPIGDKLTTFTITHVRIEETGRGVLYRIIYYIMSGTADLFGPTQDLARA